MKEITTDVEFEADPIREEYAEYSTDEGVFCVISDPENRCAWIRTEKSVDVEP